MKGDKMMLKISEMAKLANTTRRTLIYYDEEGIFSPIKKSATGYRYYSYNQLYDLLFILSLKSLGLSLDEVKQIKTNPDKMPVKRLQELLANVSQRISDLQQLQTVITQNIENSQPQDIPLYEPAVHSLPQQKFWCSPQSVGCTDEEIATLFTNFYRELSPTAMANTLKSGYLTYLALDQHDQYDESSFRVIKEVSPDSNIIMPVLEKPAGNYAMICVENTSEAVNDGLTTLQNYCQEHQLVVNEYLWQINVGKALSNKGSSKKMWLQYLVTNERGKRWWE